MGKDLLGEFVELGYLDAKVVDDRYDPYYEPSWWDGGTCAERGWGWESEHDGPAREW